MTQLKAEQVKRIPEMSKKMTAKQIADEFGVHERTINAWGRKLRDMGIETFFPKGRRPLKIK